jgi:fibro-slime domain-containing protein
MVLLRVYNSEGASGMRSPFFPFSSFTGIGSFILLLNIGSIAQLPFPDTLWVPVIFYDYHADGRGDFETCEDPNSNVGRKGMVTSALDAMRKPIPIQATACPTVASSFPCACHLGEWFKVSGRNGSDATCIFECDSLSNPDRPLWSWSNLVAYRGRIGEYTGPNYNADYEMANVVIYDSLCFRLVRNSNGVYQFNNDDFLPLNNRGFGDEPLPGDGNFGFAMEMHTKFKYQKGLSFSFRGDDDVWAFINGKLAMDLGGTHYYMDGYIDLDTIANLVPGETYSFDLYYAERHSTGSHIRITSNVISASPSEVQISVAPSDTIKAGDTVTIVGTVIDDDGEIMTVQSDSIYWTQIPSNVRTGDRIIIPRNDTTMFTGTVAYRSIGIIGTYRFGSSTIIDTTWIHIIPANPSQLDIEAQSAAALTRDQVAAGVDTFSVKPVQTITLAMKQTSAYAYAVLRDRFGNYCSLADSAGWTSDNSAVATVNYAVNGAFEGVIGRASGVLNGSTVIVVSQDALTPDTARVVLVADTLVSLRLVAIAHPEVALDTILLATDSSIAVKMQGIWSTAPGVWVDVTGIWSLQPADAVTFSTPVPATQTGQWTIAPSTAGMTRLTVTSLNASTSVPIIVKRITKLRLVNVDRSDAAISIIRMTSDSSLTVKLQGIWSTDTVTWVDLTGTWSLNPASAISFSVPLPAGEAGKWMLSPSSSGSTKLTVASSGVSVTVPVIISLADLQGPFVLGAVFIVGPLGGSYDTLKIRLSEPVFCDSLKKNGDAPALSFKVFGPGDSLKADVFEGAYYLNRRTCPDWLITEVTVITRTKIGGIVPGNDSIVLYGTAVDTAGNHPDTNRRGPVVYGPGSGIKVLPYQNSDPTFPPMVLPTEVADRFGIDESSRQVKLVMIQTHGPLVPDTGVDGKINFGKAVVFDPVANLVAADLPVRSTPFDERLYCIAWNGTNRVKRKVASGAYFLRTTVRYADNPGVIVPVTAKFTIKWK